MYQQLSVFNILYLKYHLMELFAPLNDIMPGLRHSPYRYRASGVIQISNCQIWEYYTNNDKSFTTNQPYTPRNLFLTHFMLTLDPSSGWNNPYLMNFIDKILFGPSGTLGKCRKSYSNTHM